MGGGYGDVVRSDPLPNPKPPLTPLKENEAYLRYLWIQNLESGSNSVVYVPTEAGLPILEAGKRQ